MLEVLHSQYVETAPGRLTCTFACTLACTLKLLPVPAQELWPDACVHAGPNSFTMGVDQPNKRAADQAVKKGKPARKAGIQSTAGASKPAHAMAPSSSSSSSLLSQVMPHVSSFATYAVCFVCWYLVCSLFLHALSCLLYLFKSGC